MGRKYPGINTDVPRTSSKWDASTPVLTPMYPRLVSSMYAVSRHAPELLLVLLRLRMLPDLTVTQVRCHATLVEDSGTQTEDPGKFPGAGITIGIGGGITSSAINAPLIFTVKFPLPWMGPSYRELWIRGSQGIIGCH